MRNENQSDFLQEYTTYYRLINENTRSIWSPNIEKTKCHFHTDDELRELNKIKERAGKDWKIEKCFYHSPVRV